MRESVYISSKLISVVISAVWIGITLLAAVWLLYFVFRVWESSKKVHYLKKQTDERCRDDLTNARVDYIKNVFIALICLSEVVGGVVVPVSLVLYSTIFAPSMPITGCTESSHSVIETIFHFKFSRVCLLVILSSFLVHMSLVHILTSYMVNAYAEKRVVKLGRREKLLLLLLFTQIAVVWLSVFYWRLFVLTTCIVLISIFPIHLVLFYKYSHKLYLALKRRTLDAWYEDAELHKRLEGMRKDYYRSSIAYALSVLFVGIFIGGCASVSFFEESYNHPCILNHLFFTNGTWLHGIFDQSTKRSIDVSISYVINLVCVFAFSFVLALHLYILGQAVYRQIKRRRAYNRYTGIRRTELYRPLIGNN